MPKITCRRQRFEAVLAVQKDHKVTLRPDGTCSYCGSIMASAFLAAVEEGAQVTPTDKNYKAYVRVPDPKAGKTRVVGTASGGEKPGPKWVAADTEVLAASGRATDYTTWMLLGVRDYYKTAKFYFQHLEPEDEERFLALLKEGRMKLGFPGHFYTLPYFLARREA
jgi:hypothetical protein